jgi:TM2 domain-containing membrane protein YozV
MTDQAPTTPAPIPILGCVASLAATGGGQWLNRHPLKAVLAPGALILVARHSGRHAPLAVAALVAALAIEATISALHRDPTTPMPATRPLLAGAATLAPAVPTLLLGAGPAGIVVGAGQLYNGHTARAIACCAAWWAALYWWAPDLGYAIYAIPVAASVEAFLVSFNQLDRYSDGRP